jgi:starvation-inducible DNA-binding protein
MGTVTSETKNKTERVSVLKTPSDLPNSGTAQIAESLNKLVADAYSLYIKTKNFHWHVSGPHFRDYHLLFDEHATQIFAAIDPMAERVRKIGQTTLRSVNQIASLRTIKDNEAEFVSPLQMLCESIEDNKTLVHGMRDAHEVCEREGDVGTASLLETLIDEGERRIWFLFEAARETSEGGH